MTHRSTRTALRLVRSIAIVMVVLATVTAPSSSQELPPFRPTPPTSRPTSRPATQPATPNQPGLDVYAYIRRIELAHGARAWRQRTAVEASILVTVGGNEMIKGQMLYEPSSGRVRIKTDNGDHLVFDGRQAWAVRETQIELPRFHLLTWPYFMSAPFKLRDPGTHLERTGMKTLNDQLCETAKLTFDEGTGDTPEDWYLLYPDPSTHRLRAMAYILTFGTTSDAAEQDPHAILYDEFERHDDVVLATKWTFHAWTGESGLGEQFGEARLSNVRFLEPADDAFEKPEGAQVLAPPNA